MTLTELEQIYIKNNQADSYYKMIYDILNRSEMNISQKERNDLNSLISKGVIFSTLNKNTLSELQSFHDLNKNDEFIKNNLFFLFKNEMYNFFHLPSNINENGYIKEHFSPLLIFEFIKTKNYFEEFSVDIKNNLLNLETNKKIYTPILRQGHSIIDSCINTSNNFSSFVDFWKKHKTILTSNEDFTKNISHLYQDHDKSVNLPTNYLNEFSQFVKKNKDENDIANHIYAKEKALLFSKVAKFYLNHREKFLQYTGIIPNPTFWFLNSNQTLHTQNLLCELNENHLNDFLDVKYKHYSSFKTFLHICLFNSRNANTALQRIEHLISLNFDFEQYFIETNPKFLHQNFETILKNKEKDFNVNYLYTIYNKNKLDYLLKEKSNITKIKLKI